MSNSIHYLKESHFSSSNASPRSAVSKSTTARSASSRSASSRSTSHRGLTSRNTVSRGTSLERLSPSSVSPDHPSEQRKPLTAKQRQVLGFITQCIRKRGYSPTVREIAARFGLLTANGALAHLNALEKKGYIRRKAYSSRAIQLVTQRESTSLMVHGSLREGAFQPLETPQPFEQSLELLPSREDLFLVQVQDDSLQSQHLQQGDFLILRRAATASFNEKVLFRAPIPHTFGICKMDPISQRLYLRPLDVYDQRFLNVARSILGVLVGVLRVELPPEEMLV